MGGAGDALPAGMVKRSTPTAALAAAPAFFPAAAIVSDLRRLRRRRLADADSNVGRAGERLGLVVVVHQTHPELVVGCSSSFSASLALCVAVLVVVVLFRLAVHVGVRVSGRNVAEYRQKRGGRATEAGGGGWNIGRIRQSLRQKRVTQRVKWVTPR